MPRKKAQTFKAAGAEVKEVGTGTCSEESGQDEANPRWMKLRLTRNVFFEKRCNVMEFHAFQLARWRY